MRFGLDWPCWSPGSEDGAGPDPRRSGQAACRPRPAGLRRRGAGDTVSSPPRRLPAPRARVWIEACAPASTAAGIVVVPASWGPLRGPGWGRPARPLHRAGEPALAMCPGPRARVAVGRPSRAAEGGR